MRHYVLQVIWPVGLMDKASASGAGDSRFESWAGHFALSRDALIRTHHKRDRCLRALFARVVWHQVILFLLIVDFLIFEMLDSKELNIIVPRGMG